MSRVFEALQKARVIQDGEGVSTTLSAYGLIQSIESAAKHERKTIVAPRKIPTPSAPQILDNKKGAYSHQSAKAFIEHDVFEQFQSLQIQPPLDTRLISVIDTQGAAPEAFRLLSVRLRNLQKSQSLQKLLITSTSPKEGKSFISANLACTLALGGTRKILLVEGDLRCPSLSTVFGIHPPTGICDYLSGDARLHDSIFKLEGSGIWLLPAGRPSITPVDLLDSSKAAAMVDQLADWFDWVIIDAPPTLPLADTSIWERIVDGTLLVTRLGATRKKLLAKGLESMDLYKLIGTVVNCSEESMQYGDYYYGPTTRK